MPDPSPWNLTHIPRWARVAYAARSVRRISVLVQGDMAEEFGTRFKMAVEAMEHFARVGSIRPDLEQFETFLRELRNQGVHSKATASGFSLAAVQILPILGKIFRDPDDLSPFDDLQRQLTRAAERHSKAFARIEFKAREFDLLLLGKMAVTEDWDDDTSIPPSFFGSIWPFGPPAEFHERDSRGAEISIELSVPEGMTDSDVLELVKRTVLQADGLHRAYGGHGLRVDVGGVEIEREACVPVGGGS